MKVILNKSQTCGLRGVIVGPAQGSKAEGINEYWGD
jgi:hypothetical protein